ncbi:MAG: hypothetical protein RJB62_577 [Pseudomonadota bacterium]
MTTGTPRAHAPATLRNREPILEILQRVLPAKGIVLEIASGTGEHVAYFAPRLSPDLLWQPSDVSADKLNDIDLYARESRAMNILAALVLDTQDPWPLHHADAILCCNMIHIAPWEAAIGLIEGAARVLPANAPLVLYGPYKRQGEHTAPSNAEFDKGLKARNPRWGLRCLDTDVLPLAIANGFRAEEIIPMPANNLAIVLRRTE